MIQRTGAFLTHLNLLRSMTTPGVAERASGAPLTLGGEQTAAGEAASPALCRQRAAGDLPPHRRRRMRYLKP